MNKKAIILSGIIVLFMFFPFLKTKALDSNEITFNHTDKRCQEENLCGEKTIILPSSTKINKITYETTDYDYYYVKYGYAFDGIQITISKKEFVYNNEKKIFVVDNFEIGDVLTFEYSKTGSYLNSFVASSLGTESFAYVSSKFLKSNIDIYDLNGNLFRPNDTIPSISFSLVDSEKYVEYDREYYYSKTFKIDFSSINNDKYYYEYSNDLFENNIETIMLTQNNFFQKTFTENGTFSVRIKDRTTNKTVSINTLTISEIKAHQVENIIYKSMIKIPISDFYDSSTQKWKSKVIFARGRKNNDTNIQLRFEFENDELSNKEEFPILLYVDNDILNINDYMQKYTESPESNSSGFGGGLSLTTENGFGGGGGGGRFGDSCSSLPISYSRETYSKSKYLALKFLTNNCDDLTGKTPEDFKTKNIVVYYNATLFSSEEQILNDYTSSLPGFEQDDDGNTTIGKFYNMVLKKFPIIEQLGTIISKFSNMNFSEEKPKIEINLSSIFPGTQKMSVIDLSFYDEYRDYIFLFIKASCVLIILPKLYRIVKDLFSGGGDS